MSDVVWLPKLCGDVACVVRWLDGWQTLVGAAIAIPFVAIAIGVSLYHEHQRREAKLAALRATMPLRLSMVSHYAVATMQAMAAIRTRQGVRKGSEFVKPTIPDGLADGFERTIEAIHNRRVVHRLSNMIGEMQVLDSRMSSLNLEDESGGNVDTYILQAATIHAQNDSLYDFARRRSSTTKRRLDWSDVQRAFMIARVYDATHPDVHAFVARLNARKHDPEDNDPRDSVWHRLQMKIAIKREKFDEWRKARRRD